MKIFIICALTIIEVLNFQFKPQVTGGSKVFKNKNLTKKCIDGTYYVL